MKMGELSRKNSEKEGLFCYAYVSANKPAQEEKPLLSIHQTGYKLLYQIEKFSGELCVPTGKVRTRFVKEMLYGLLSSGSVRLTEIARALEEPITLHKTHDRLSRNLKHHFLEKELEDSLLQLASPYIHEKTLIIIDPTEIVKPYARKMEYLGDVRDGSKKVIGKGYWLYPVVGYDKTNDRIVPLVNRLYSSIAPGFKSENEHILEITDQVFNSTKDQGIIVMDRGGDRMKLFKPWLQNPKLNFIVRQRGDRHLIYRNGKRLCQDLAKQCSLKYTETVTRINRDGKSRTYELKFGFMPVRLPGYPDRKLYLVVVDGFGEEPLMILTTLQMRRKRKVVWDVVESYIARWRIEDTIRYIKQSYKLEDVRVLTYQRLKNMITLVMAASFFTCVYLGWSERLKILVGHTLKAAKRLFGIPDFNYYSISDGIQYILTRFAPRRRKIRPPDEDIYQRKLFEL